MVFHAIRRCIPADLVLSRDPIQSADARFHYRTKGYPTTHFDMDAVEAIGLGENGYSRAGRPGCDPRHAWNC
jgi:hypothetical protein